MIGFFSALLLGSSSLGAAYAQPAPHGQGEPIIVTGERIGDLRRRLEECLARRCPTNEDVDATMALAEALFMEGEYEDARRAIRSSIGRNRRHAAAYPEPVSDLYRGRARLSRHMGHDRDAMQSTREVLRILRVIYSLRDVTNFTEVFAVDLQGDFKVFCKVG